MTVGELFRTFTGGTPHKGRPELYGSEHPFYKPADMKHGSVVEEADDGLSEMGLAAVKTVEPQSIMVTCIGASIGKTSMAAVKGACNQQINVMLPNRQVDMSYFLHYCCSDSFQQQIKRVGSFANMPILSLGKFNKLVIPVPSIEEQRRIARELHEANAVSERLNDGLRSEIELRQVQLTEFRNRLLSFPEKVA